MVLLNKKLLQQQGIDSETEMGIQATHTVLELILNNPELVGIDSVSDVVRGLEFALQKLWNFPQDENFHRYQFMTKGCECPRWIMRTCFDQVNHIDTTIWSALFITL